MFPFEIFQAKNGGNVERYYDHYVVDKSNLLLQLISNLCHEFLTPIIVQYCSMQCQNYFHTFPYYLLLQVINMPINMFQSCQKRLYNTIIIVSNFININVYI